MPPDVAQEIEVVQRVKPLGIVDHQRVGRRVAKRHIARKHSLDPGDVVVDLRGRQQRPLLGAE